MSTCKRHGKKWTHNEILSLQREYELLEWDLQTIANKHKRSVNSIIYKLYSEGITETLLNDVKTKNNINHEEENNDDLDSSSDSVDDNDADKVDKNITTLTDRVWTLETSVSNISLMVKQLFDKITNRKEVKSSLKN